MDASLIGRIDRLLARGGRVLGIGGAPGAGKSTLAEAIVGAFGERAQLLPMDGFHYANDELARLGRADRKGAPDTFDVDGYVAALQRVRDRRHDVLVPRFVRAMEGSLANAIRVGTATELVVTEGNYLALDLGPWSQVRPLLDECWVVSLDDDVRRARLVARHEAHGRPHAEAVRWVDEVDEPNAVLVRANHHRADHVLTRW